MPHDAESAARELRAMGAALEDYLLDESLFKTIGVPAERGDTLIKMTLGAMLERIAALDEQGSAPDVVADARAALDHARSMMGDRYFARLAREAKSYTDSWNWFLQNCWEGAASCAADYPTEVAARLRLARLLDEGEGRPELAEQRQRIQALDERLRAIWEPAPHALLVGDESRYPRERYWWLYGRPAPRRDR